LNKSKKRKLPEVKKAVNGKGEEKVERQRGGRRSWQQRGRRRESWLKEGEGDGTFCRQYFEIFRTGKYKLTLKTA
jgi:hypothetical protein